MLKTLHLSRGTRRRPISLPTFRKLHVEMASRKVRRHDVVQLPPGVGARQTHRVIVCLARLIESVTCLTPDGPKRCSRQLHHSPVQLLPDLRAAN
jgi:hypothetical protein